MPSPSLLQRLKERKLVGGAAAGNGMLPHFVVLVALWVLIVTTLLSLLAQGVRQTGEHQVFRWVLQGLYVASLVWYLARTGPPLARLPEIASLVLKRWRGGPWIPVVFVALLFLLVVGSSDGADIALDPVFDFVHNKGNVVVQLYISHSAYLDTIRDPHGLPRTEIPRAKIAARLFRT